MATDQFGGIARLMLRSEAECVRNIVAAPPLSLHGASFASARAARWITTLRGEKDRHTLLDSFLAEYGLSNEEGVALMCLAEAFLRIPDPDTAASLIVDTITGRNWQDHLGHAESWLVNSSTWALMLTGRAITLDARDGLPGWRRRLLDRLGGPVLQAAVRTAMRILASEFVVGESIDAATIHHAQATPAQGHLSLCKRIHFCPARTLRQRPRLSASPKLPAPFCCRPTVEVTIGGWSCVVPARSIASRSPAP